MKRVKNLLLLGLVFISCYSFSQELMSEMKFTQYMQEEVAKSNAKLKILIFDELILGSKFNNASFMHNLKNDYPTYKLKPENLKALAEELTSRIDSIYAPDPNYKVDPSKIVPLLKPKGFVHTIVTNDGNEAIYDKFNEDLAIIYVEDQSSGYLGYRYFSHNELKKIGYEKDSLYDLSLRNLKAMLSDYSDNILDQGKYRIYRSVGGEGGSKYLSSLILFPDFLKKEKKRLGQNVVIGIPKENQLIIVGKNNQAGIREIKNYATANYYLKPEELLTNALYLWNGKDFKRF